MASKIVFAALLSLAAVPAHAKAFHYLPEPDLATARQRSVTEGAAVGVAGGAPWWGFGDYQCTSGTRYFVVIEDAIRPDSVNGSYDFTANPKGTTGLSSAERSSLLSEQSLAADSCVAN